MSIRNAFEFVLSEFNNLCLKYGLENLYWKNNAIVTNES